jgi:small-conductance mechanosensitive channel
VSATSSSLVAAGVLALAAVVIGPVVRAVLRRRGREAIAADLQALTWPVRLVAAALASRIVLASAERGERLAPVVGLLLVVAVAWVLVRAFWVFEQMLFRRLSIDAADNLRARSRRTQLSLLRRVLVVAIVVGAGFVALFTLTPLGRLGSSFVAYAGLVGVVLGVALRAPLENLAAGIIVAVTEPIRIDDVVVVDDEWGRVEQIGLMNTVVRAWDDRRLVLPTARFVNERFENWTRRSASLLGTVTMWVDYGTDIERLRAEVRGVVDASPLWDRRLCVVQVVELGERGVQVRAVVSTANASAAWDLRCEIRERIQAYLAANRDWLPVVRLDDAEAGLTATGAR